jgi:hypothetical protein
VRQVGAVLFEFAFQLFNEPGDERSLLSQSGNDVWIAAVPVVWTASGEE